MAGTKIMATSEGVALLKALAEGVDQNADNIKQKADQLSEDVNQYPALGPHKASIERIVGEIKTEIESSSNPARVVAKKLREKADAIQEWIDDDLFGDSGK